MKYLDINLTKYLQDLYKTLMREIKELNKWRAIPYLWIERLNGVTTSVLAILIYRFNAMKNPAGYFVDINELVLKFTR